MGNIKQKYKSLYWQQFLLSAGLVMLTLVLLGVSFFALSYNYTLSQRREEMRTRADLVARMSTDFLRTEISTDVQKNLQDLAVRFYKEFNCRDLVRVDFIIGDDDGVPYILEGNSLPGFTATSLVPKAAACMNISFERLCASLVRAHRKNQGEF
jgi:hypothetical protein